MIRDPFSDNAAKLSAILQNFRGSAAELMACLRFWPGGDCYQRGGTVIHRAYGRRFTWRETAPGVWRQEGVALTNGRGRG
jgi:hypothetical protein